MAAGVTFFELAGIPETYVPVAGSALVAVTLTAVGLAVRSRVKSVDDHIVPAPGVSLLNIGLSITSYFRNLLDSIVGHGSDKYVPFVAGTFLVVLFSNYSGLLPGWLPPTDNLNTNLGMALCVFLLYNLLGLKEHGVGYFKQFTGGLPAPGYGVGVTITLTLIAGLVLFIELVGHAVRPLALSFRLWGNINGDHALLGTATSLVPLLLPIAAMVVGLFVGLVQAFVFSLLTTVYIKLAVSHDH